MNSSSLNSDVLGICRILYKHSVDYLIVGGTAVAFYGIDRITRDIGGNPLEKHDFDFWYNPSYNNYFRLLNALEDLGLDVLKYKKRTGSRSLQIVFQV